MVDLVAFPTSQEPVLLALALGVSGIAAFTDVQEGRIPNRLTLPALVIALGYILFSENRVFLADHLLGFATNFVLFSLLFRLRMIGGGDAKLFMVLGLIFPFPHLFWVLAFVFITGGLQAVITHIFFHQKSMPYALAVFLGVAIYGAVVMGVG